MIFMTEPISPSIQWAQKMLFRPFSAGKWFVLGFCAFLARLAGGGGVNPRFGNSFSQGKALDRHRGRIRSRG